MEKKHKKKKPTSLKSTKVSHTFEVLGCFSSIGFGKTHRIKEFHEFHHTWHRNGQNLLQIKGIEKPQEKNCSCKGLGVAVVIVAVVTLFRAKKRDPKKFCCNNIL